MSWLSDIWDSVSAGYGGMKDRLEEPLAPEPERTLAGNWDQSDPRYDAATQDRLERILPSLITVPESLGRSALGGMRNLGDMLVSGARGFGDSSKSVLSGDLSPVTPRVPESLMRVVNVALSPAEEAKAAAAYNTNRARALDAVAKKYERQNAEMQARLDSLRSLSSEGTQVFVAGGKDSRGKEMEYDPRGYETEGGPETPSKGTYSKTGEGFSAVSGAYGKKDLEKMGVEGQMADVLERIGRISPGAQLQVVQSLVGGRESPTQKISADLDKLSQARNPRLGVEALKSKLKLRYPTLSDEQLEEMVPILKMFKSE